METITPSTNDTTLTCPSHSMPQWEAILTIIILSIIIIFTIVGNVLVILSVFTHRPLRIVQNFFIVSLAVADLTVAILVLPFNVAYSVLGKWIFGIHVCKMWLTSDILCCTASILNLCAIALDRFWAITDPINYAQKRTVNRVLLMIGGVWVLSLIISSPPLLGWNDWLDEPEFSEKSYCALTEKKGYVIYSASGSFFIPLIVMAIVYFKIFVATKRRLRERAKQSKLNAISMNNAQQRNDSISSDNEESAPKKQKKRKKKQKREAEKSFLKPELVHEDSITDNADAGPSDNNKDIPNTATTSVANSPLSVNNKFDAQKKSKFMHQFIEEKQKISLSKERKAARTLGIIMGVFVVCWLPFFLMYVIKPFFCADCCPSPYFTQFITWLGYINSALNPIIYTIFNLDFRRAFKKLLGINYK